MNTMKSHPGNADPALPIIASLLEYAERFADAAGEPENGDCRKTISKAKAFMEPKAQPGLAGGFYPELGDEAPHRLFHSEHIGRSYDLTWRAFQDEKARATLRELNVRPGHIRRLEPGDCKIATSLGCDVFTCLITPAAHKKLSKAGVIATKLLLD